MTATLVTGGTGFIGSELVRQLVRRGETPVRVPSRRAAPPESLAGLDGVELVAADLATPDGARRAFEGCGRAYHLAGWISTRRRDRDAVFAANLETTRNVLTAAAEVGVERLVVLASIFALGGGGPQPVDETTARPPEDLGIAYIEAKQAAEREVARAVREGLPVVEVYPTYCLGAGDVEESSAGVLLEYLRRPVGLYMKGGLNVVHVADAARGLRLGMERGEIGRKYLVGGDNVTWEELLGRAARVAGVRPPTRAIPSRLLRATGVLAERLAPGLGLDGARTRLATRYWFYDDGRARRELGYSSRPLDETLAESVDWYRRAGKLRGAPNEEKEKAP